MAKVTITKKINGAEVIVESQERTTERAAEEALRALAKIERQTEKE